MSSKAERAAALAALGLGLAAIRQFSPLSWPYDLGPNWSVATQAWFFFVDLLWVAAMVVTYWRQPTGRMWTIFLAFQLVATLGVMWIVRTSLTWTLSQLLVGLGGVVFVHLVLAFPTG